MCTCKESTSQELFVMINKTLSQFGISWKNRIAMLFENTSVNLGRKNFIMARVLNTNPAIYLMDVLVTLIPRAKLQKIDRGSWF